jgi:hypothetical protein
MKDTIIDKDKLLIVNNNAIVKDNIKSFHAYAFDYHGTALSEGKVRFEFLIGDKLSIRIDDKELVFNELIKILGEENASRD